MKKMSAHDFCKRTFDCRSIYLTLSMYSIEIQNLTIRYNPPDTKPCITYICDLICHWFVFKRVICDHYVHFIWTVKILFPFTMLFILIKRVLMWPYFNVLLDRFDCKYNYFIVSPYKSWLKTFFVNINDDKTILGKW